MAHQYLERHVNARQNNQVNSIASSVVIQPEYEYDKINTKQHEVYSYKYKQLVQPESDSKRIPNINSTLNYSPKNNDNDKPKLTSDSEDNSKKFSEESEQKQEKHNNFLSISPLLDFQQNNCDQILPPIRGANIKADYTFDGEYFESIEKIGVFSPIVNLKNAIKQNLNGVEHMNCEKILKN